MTDRVLEATLGGLLHDIGKALYREGGDARNHSKIGYDFLANEIQFENKQVLDCIRYHHGYALKNASISDNALAYIVYFADNVASSIDRRTKDDEEEKGFELHTPIQPVFNLLNGNDGAMWYSPYCYNVEERINYPIEEKKEFTKEQYSKINDNIIDCLKNIDLSYEYINSLLEVLEANLSFVPSSTSKKEVPDISLFDHLKITAALSGCILKYIDEKENLKSKIYLSEDKFGEEDIYLMASLDFSGIQNFIYTTHSKNALKNLRARSFYLEIMMEHIIDEILERLDLSRTNLLYSGGGHCYLLLPNTDNAKTTFDEYIDSVNKWIIERFDIELYLAGAYKECSSNDLKNKDEGSYENVFKSLSNKLSKKKLNRYSDNTIKDMNNHVFEDYSRECKICKRVDELDSEGRCKICASLENFSKNVLYSDFFVVESMEGDNLPLPLSCGLRSDKKESLKEKMKDDETYIRSYSKNESYTGKYMSTKLWVGNYTTRASFEEFASGSKGVKRVGILRADVDNLGQAFVRGFKNSANNDRYVTISRTATLSRQLSLFFKLHINKILNTPEFSLDGVKKEQRNATIVYSGGDDIFVVGSWNEIIEFAVDLHNSFKKYSENTLTISAGIGLYDDSYPISVSAYEVEELVDESKKLDNKNGITVLPDGVTHKMIVNGEEESISDGTYKWNEFIECVIEEKFKIISDYMSVLHNEHGNALLYRILELIRSGDERISFARFIYLLSRLEPEKGECRELEDMYNVFSRSMVEWFKSDVDRRHLKTAIELYVYLNREEEESNNENN